MVLRPHLLRAPVRALREPGPPRRGGRSAWARPKRQAATALHDWALRRRPRLDLPARIGVEKPVVVGHSMGGIVAFDLAARYPDMPSTVVMLDAAVVLPSATRAAIPSLLKQLRGPDYQNVLRGYASKDRKSVV